MTRTTRVKSGAGETLRVGATILGVALLASLVGGTLGSMALAFGSADKVYHAGFTTDCNGCDPIMAVNAWPDGHANGSPRPYSVIMANDGCTGGTAMVNDAGHVVSSGDLWVTVQLDLSGGFCSGSVDWRAAWGHVG